MTIKTILILSTIILSTIILSTIIFSLIIYAALISLRLAQAHIYKSRNHYMKLAQILPIRHNTKARQKKLTEGQLKTVALVAIFTITCTVISLTMGLLENLHS